MTTATTFTKVFLEGPMGKEFGREWSFCNIDSPGKALKMVECNKPGLLAWIRSRLDKIPSYRVVVEHLNGVKEDLDAETIQMNAQIKSIRFVPLIGGASGGVKIVLGVVLLAASVVVGAWSFGWAAPVSAGLWALGWSLIVGGALQLLIQPPGQEKNKSNDPKSDYFDGPTNTTQQGAPVPLIYGRCLVGSQVISAAVDVTTDTQAVFDDTGDATAAVAQVLKIFN